MVWVRNHEKHNREPFFAVLKLFVFGATLGIAMALLLNGLFGVGIAQTGTLGIDSVVLATVIGAPFLEELSKGVGLGFTRRRMLELEDGIIYGAAIGLGFSATENLVYGLVAFQDGGLAPALTTEAARVFSSSLLHGGTTALLGFGYSKMVLRGDAFPTLLPFYLLAVVMHAVYNYLVLSRSWTGFAVAMVLVFAVAGYLRKQIRTLDAKPPHEVA